ncbi:MGMT family protein [Geomesophilobacter sediminis]|uniref:MGMT family protein n=1 Tax=Geomesophilobacter sediminis TaxID=2798584 RepID=A0A8J7INN7_9BACT|nr:MGMT family protein [Geomesophilobacter sediminis]MBJ6723724.1 MGMT family protein [Geomesophilobacter sediminis]
MEPESSKYARIYHVVSLIPPGRVATYGQVALLAGLPGRARLVGHVLSASTDRSLPWFRVVNASGGISIRSGAISSDTEQRLRLEHEGVVFDAHGRLSLERYRWRPEPGEF